MKRGTPQHKPIDCILIPAYIALLFHDRKHGKIDPQSPGANFYGKVAK